MQFVFHLFFASLNVMLVFSSGIILYTGLYNSPETHYLLTLPIRAERIVLYKFQEAVFFSSWGFFLLASPIMIAYGIVAGAPWYYYVLLAAADRFVRLHSLRHRRDLLLADHSQAAATCGRSLSWRRCRVLIGVTAPLDLANGQQPAIAAVRQRVVSGNAAPLSLHAAGMAAEHVADQRPAGGRAAAGGRRCRRRGRSADRAKRAVSGAVDFQRAVPSRADGVGGEALVSRELCQLCLPARRGAARCGWHSSDRIVSHAAVAVSAAAATAADQGLAAAAPRSGAMVAVPDLLRPAWVCIFSTSIASTIRTATSATSRGSTWSAS